MAKGIEVPIRVNKRGGIVMLEGNKNNEQILRLALSDNENANAFQQDIGMNQDIIFGTPSTNQRQLILKRLYNIFSEFEELRRFKLMPETIKWYVDHEEGELILEFMYNDLESDELILFTTKYSTATGV